MSVESLELENIQINTPVGEPIVGNYLELVKNIKVNLEVIVGRTEISVGELLDLKKNSVVKLENDLATPLEIVIDGKVIARGTLAAVDDNFAIKITEITDKALRG